MPDASAPRSRFDEHTIARAVRLGLPLVTLSVAAVVGVLVGGTTSVLVLAAGLLLGVIALLWGSLRVLSGDAPLPAELEELEMESRGVDALASRKEMLLRALKDLEHERSIGKIEDDDYAQLSATYRGELKTVLKKIDASLAPYRARAEAAARAHLARAGLADTGYRGEPPPEIDAAPPDETRAAEALPAAEAPALAAPAGSEARIPCPSCNAMNETDAKFCKGCGAPFASEPARGVESAPREEPVDAR